MPADYLFYWLTRPLGLLLVAIAVLVPFLVWRYLLGNQYAVIGSGPLALAYLCALAGLVINSFWFSCREFNSRALKGLLLETERWSIIPGWTVYTAVVSLTFVLGALALLGVPVAVWLIKSGRLTYRNIAASVITFWFSLSVLLSAIPVNEWHRTHRLESVSVWLKELFPDVAFIVVPFFLAVYLTSHRKLRMTA